MNRRSFIKKSIISILSFFGLSGSVYYYAREIEPSLLDVHSFDIKSTRIPKSFDDFKILQFTDTHIGFHYTLEQFEKLVQKINSLNADLVLFTGDLLDDPSNHSVNLDHLVAALSRITATTGKYWVYGNHDHGGYGTDIVKDIFDKSGFSLLKNESVLIPLDNDYIQLAGLDDAMLGKPDLSTTLLSESDGLFTLLMVHEPDIADFTKQYPIDVQLSGHSHGGQIQIPFYGYIYTPYLAEKYVEGAYQLGEYPLQLFVSRGIGTTRLPYRFLCKPEISLYKLKHNT
ncbi:hypothetical protein GGQ92_000063 [Gracilibacillus halotolerans]|uniref:Calcineurin-like phosphoesterase domain-containing protein n=1 Tax=Gracilibacillus halotolerans TaxID=74386 RepID=A0A841RII9_9BACI|nr:hypothetical protein [Gracilibacillus halotolerans]